MLMVLRRSEGDIQDLVDLLLFCCVLQFWYVYNDVLAPGLFSWEVEADFRQLPTLYPQRVAPSLQPPVFQGGQLPSKVGTHTY